MEIGTLNLKTMKIEPLECIQLTTEEIKILQNGGIIAKHVKSSIINSNIGYLQAEYNNGVIEISKV